MVRNCTDPSLLAGSFGMGEGRRMTPNHAPRAAGAIDIMSAGLIRRHRPLLHGGCQRAISRRVIITRLRALLDVWPRDDAMTTQPNAPRCRGSW